MNPMPPITKNLLLINVAVFLFSAFSSVNLEDLFGLHFFMASHFSPYQFVSYMFLHANFTHLLFNMFALWMFGRVMEQVLGPKRFLILYMVCGIGAGLMQELAQYIYYTNSELSRYPAEALNGWLTVGASGAIYGILLSFGYTFPDQRLFIIPFPFPIKAKYLIAGYAAIEVFSMLGQAADNVAHMAHLGGMLFAWLLLVYWKKPRQPFQFLKPKKPTHSPTTRRATRGDCEMDYNAQRKARQEEVDRILMKVRHHGYGSLTEDEKKKLFEASNE